MLASVTRFLTDFAVELWSVLLDLSPWLLIGMFVAGVLHVLMPKGFARAHFGGRGIGSLLKAAGLGVPLPLCSCGVIPAAIGLKKDGASNGAATGFLISTPQTGVDSLLVSASFLGWPFAVFKMVSALVAGVVGGMIVNAYEAAKEEEVSSEDIRDGDGSFDVASNTPWYIELFRFGFGRLLRDIYVWVILGVVGAAAIGALVPENFFADVPFMQGWLGMVAMLVIATPIYVCATSSVPIAAALIQAGMPAGSALVFLMAGPATNVATVGAIFKSFGKRVTAIYLATVVVSSILLGWLFQFVLADTGRVALEGHSHVVPHWVALTSVALLLALLVYYLLSDARGWIRAVQARAREGAEGMESMELEVEGMTCQNCVAHVRRALEGVSGVSTVEVDLGKGRADVKGESLTADDLIAAVDGAGYKARRA